MSDGGTNLSSFKSLSTCSITRLNIGTFSSERAFALVGFQKHFRSLFNQPSCVKRTENKEKERQDDTGDEVAISMDGL